MNYNNSNERLMVFVDVRNVCKKVENDRRYCRPDFKGLVNLLSNGRRLIRPYAYDGSLIAEGEDRSRRFHDHLRANGFEVRARNIYSSDDDVKQKGVDVELACDMVLFAKQDLYDVAILVSGDGDFIPAVERIKDMGKIVEVASFSDEICGELRLLSDRFWNLDSVPFLSMRSVPDDQEAI